MSTVDSSSKVGRHLVVIVRIGVAMVLGVIGAAAGFTHTRDWAAYHGQTGWLAWADAVVIEGIVIVAGFEVQRDHRAGNTRKFTFPLAVLIAGFGVQMTAQVSLAEPTAPGWLVAAMPALCFLVVVKLLMRRAPADPPEVMPAESAPAPPAVVAAPVALPASPAAPLSRLKLPPELTGRITTAVAEVRQEGREPTVEDIRRAARVSEDMAVRILADVTGRNGHTL